MKLIAIILSSAGLLLGSFALFANDEVKEVLPKIIYEIGEVDVKPRPTKQVAPFYPKKMKQECVDGKVTLVFIVKNDGSVGNIRIEESSNEAFEQPSIDAIEQWEFTPGFIDGNAVDVQVRAPLLFKVNPGSMNLLYELENSKDSADKDFYKTLLIEINEMNELHDSGDLEEFQVLWEALKGKIEAYNRSKKS